MKDIKSKMDLRPASSSDDATRDVLNQTYELLTIPRNANVEREMSNNKLYKETNKQQRCITIIIIL